MQVLPVLKTERLVLRLPGVDEAGEVRRYYEENWEHLAPTHPLLPPEAETFEYWNERLKSGLLQFAQGRGANFFLFKQGEPARVIGNLSLSGIARGSSESCYLGYNLAQDAQGKGYMTEAVQAAVQYAFGELRLHRIMAAYLPHNERSGRLLRRVGFRVEGYAYDYLLIAGRWQDHILTSLTSPEWCTSSAGDLEGIRS